MSHSQSSMYYDLEMIRNHGRFIGIARHIRDSEDKEYAAKIAIKYLLEALEQHDHLQQLKREEKLCNQE